MEMKKWTNVLLVLALIASFIPGVALASAAPTVWGFSLTADARTVVVEYSVAIKNPDRTKITITNGSTTVANTAYTAAVSSTANNVLLVTLSKTTATFKSGFTIMLGAGAVQSMSDVASNASSTITLTPAKFATLTSASLDNTNKIATLKFSGLITRSPQYTSNEGRFEYSTNKGKTYTTTVPGGATAYISNDEATIIFGMSQANIMIRIKAGTLRHVPQNGTHGLLNGVITSKVIEPYPYATSNSNDILDNKTFSLIYSENIKNASALTDPVAAATELKSKISFAMYGNDFSPTYEPLAAQDTVTISGKKLTVKFAQPIVLPNGNASPRIKVEANALSDIQGNLLLEHTNPYFFQIDSLKPYVEKAIYQSNRITLLFSENIFINTSMFATPALFAAALRYDTDKSFTNPTVTISKNQLIINHATTGISSKSALVNLVIPANGLRDLASNVFTDTTISATEIDGEAPAVSGYKLSNGNKNIFIAFDEDVKSVASNLPMTALTITTGTGETAVTKPISDLAWKTSTTTVRVVFDEQLGRGIRVTNLKTALAENNIITIKTNSITDNWKNANTSPIAFTLDLTAPVLSGSSVASIGTNSVNVSVQSSELGDYRYIAFPDGHVSHYITETTSDSDIIGSINYYFVPDAIVSPTVKYGKGVVAAGSNTLSIPQLAAGTKYFVYFYVKDFNNSSNVVRLAVTTTTE